MDEQGFQISDLYFPAILIFSGILALLGFAFDLKTTNGKMTKFGWWSAALLVAITVLTVLNENVKEDEDLRRFRASVSRLDTLLLKTDTTIDSLRANLDTSRINLRKTDSSIKSLNKLQTKSNNILRDLDTQFVYQKALNKNSVDLLTKMMSGIKMQEELLANTDRVLNPLVPFHLYLDYSVSLDDPKFNQIAVVILRIRNLLETDSTIRHEDLMVIRNRQNPKKVDQLKIRNWSKVLAFLRFNHELLPGFGVGFIHNDSVGKGYDFPPKFVFLGSANFTANISVPQQINSPYGQVFVDFNTKQVAIETHFTDIRNEQRTKRLFGISDLENYNLQIESNLFSSEVHGITLCVGQNFMWRIVLAAKTDRFNYVKQTSFSKLFMHRLQKWEVEFFVASNYWMGYYDRTDGLDYHLKLLSGVAPDK